MLDMIVLGAVAAEAARRAWTSRGGAIKGGGSTRVVVRDPNVDGSHPLGVGVSPCPGNPPLPAGFAYWTGPVSPALTAWAVEVRNSYPIGSFIQDVVDGKNVAARIEYHTLQGATGRTGCFKGLSLLRPV